MSFSFSSVTIETGIILLLKTPLEQGLYHVVMRVFDNSLHSQDNTVQANVCDCTGEEVKCIDKAAAAFGLTGVLGILGAILALLCKMLLFFFFYLFISYVMQI